MDTHEIVPRRPVTALPAPEGTETPIDLLALVTSGLRPLSVAAYRADYERFREFTGHPDAATALWALLALDTPRANGVALAWRTELESAGLRPATIARRLAALRRAVNRARMVGLTTASIEAQSPTVETYRDTAGPGRSGWERMLTKARQLTANKMPRDIRNLAIVLLLHDRGMRRGEVVTLDYPGDYDPERPGVNVLGKGRSDKEWLTINLRTNEALSDWIKARGPDPGPFFMGLPERKRIDGATINRMVKKLARSAGLRKVPTAHGLRHSAITEALDRGWDVRDVKAFSRHKSIDTVLVYDDRRGDVGGRISEDLGKGSRARKGSFSGA